MSDFLKGFVAVIAVTVFYLVFEYGREFDSTDESATRIRSGLILLTDHGTGCQYLSFFFSAPTPRLGADGKQICTGASK